MRLYNKRYQAALKRGERYSEPRARKQRQTPQTKVCRKCGKRKLAKLFYQSPRTSDTLHPYCRLCHKKYTSQHYLQNKERHNLLGRARHATIKLLVLIRYSADPPHCACCKAETLAFLGLDHIEGGGTAHKRAIGENIYRHLVRLGKQPGLRVLCHNCNFARGLYGRCPHEAPLTVEASATRAAVLAHYGHACACCAEAHEAFLVLDHPNGDGAAHRKLVGDVPWWVAKNGFPSDFRLLCHNCNASYAFTGQCHGKLGTRCWPPSVKVPGVPNI